MRKKLQKKVQIYQRLQRLSLNLWLHLDFKVGGDLAVELESLYVFMIDKLIEANIKNDPEVWMLLKI